MGIIKAVARDINKRKRRYPPPRSETSDALTSGIPASWFRLVTRFPTTNPGRNTTSAWDFNFNFGTRSENAMFTASMREDNRRGNRDVDDRATAR
jgi:hypothetical protein